MVQAQSMQLVALALALSLAPLGAQDPSPSKLSVHLICSYTQGARQIVEAGPAVLKVLDLHTDMLEAMRDYKARWPYGLTVVRVYTPPFALPDDPAEAGALFFDRVLAPAIEGLSEEDRSLIDFLEGPNECEHFMAWESVENAVWYAAFWQDLAQRIYSAGFRPCVAAIPVGNPPGSLEDVQARFRAFAPALRTAHELEGAWSYHSYSLAYTTDTEAELWTSLRYRLMHQALEEGFSDLLDMPLIITESGIDLGGNPDTDGWQARGNEDDFVAWLQWYDDRLAEDDYVIGSTLFQSGCPYGWASFEVEPVAASIAGHIRQRRGSR